MNRTEIFNTNEALLKQMTVNEAVVITKSTWLAIHKLPVDDRLELITILADYSLYGELLESDNDYLNAIAGMYVPNAIAMQRRHEKAVDDGNKNVPEKKFKDEDIIELKQQGLSNSQIATEIGCHMSTVKRAISKFKEHAQGGSEPGSYEPIDEPIADEDKPTNSNGVIRVHEIEIEIENEPENEPEKEKENEPELKNENEKLSPVEENYDDIIIDDSDLEIFNNKFGTHYTDKDVVILLEDLRNRLDFRGGGFRVYNFQFGKMLDKISMFGEQDKPFDIESYLKQSNMRILLDINKCAGII